MSRKESEILNTQNPTTQTLDTPTPEQREKLLQLDEKLTSLKSKARDLQRQEKNFVLGDDNQEQYANLHIAYVNNQKQIAEVELDAHLILSKIKQTDNDEQKKIQLEDTIKKCDELLVQLKDTAKALSEQSSQHLVIREGKHQAKVDERINSGIELYDLTAEENLKKVVFNNTEYSLPKSIVDLLIENKKSSEDKYTIAIKDSCYHVTSKDESFTKFFEAIINTHLAFQKLDAPNRNQELAKLEAEKARLIREAKETRETLKKSNQAKASITETKENLSKYSEALENYNSQYKDINNKINELTEKLKETEQSLDRKLKLAYGDTSSYQYLGVQPHLSPKFNNVMLQLTTASNNDLLHYASYFTESARLIDSNEFEEGLSSDGLKNEKIEGKLADNLADIIKEHQALFKHSSKLEEYAEIAKEQLGYHKDTLICELVKRITTSREFYHTIRCADGAKYNEIKELISSAKLASPVHIPAYEAQSMLNYLNVRKDSITRKTKSISYRIMLAVFSSYKKIDKDYTKELIEISRLEATIKDQESNVDVVENLLGRLFAGNPEHKGIAAKLFGSDSLINDFLAKMLKQVIAKKQGSAYSMLDLESLKSALSGKGDWHYQLSRLMKQANTMESSLGLKYFIKELISDVQSYQKKTFFRKISDSQLNDIQITLQRLQNSISVKNNNSADSYITLCSDNYDVISDFNKHQKQIGSSQGSKFGGVIDVNVNASEALTVLLSQDYIKLFEKQLKAFDIIGDDEKLDTDTIKARLKNSTPQQREKLFDLRSLSQNQPLGDKHSKQHSFHYLYGQFIKQVFNNQISFQDKLHLMECEAIGDPELVAKTGMLEPHSLLVTQLLDESSKLTDGQRTSDLKNNINIAIHSLNNAKFNQGKHQQLIQALSLVLDIIDGNIDDIDKFSDDALDCLVDKTRVPENQSLKAFLTARFFKEEVNLHVEDADKFLDKEDELSKELVEARVEKLTRIQQYLKDMGARRDDDNQQQRNNQVRAGYVQNIRELLLGNTRGKVAIDKLVVDFSQLGANAALLHEVNFWVDYAMSSDLGFALEQFFIANDIAIEKDSLTKLTTLFAEKSWFQASENMGAALFNELAPGNMPFYNTVYDFYVQFSEKKSSGLATGLLPFVAVAAKEGTIEQYLARTWPQDYLNQQLEITVDVENDDDSVFRFFKIIKNVDCFQQRLDQLVSDFEWNPSLNWNNKTDLFLQRCDASGNLLIRYRLAALRHVTQRIINELIAYKDFASLAPEARVNLTAYNPEQLIALNQQFSELFHQLKEYCAESTLQQVADDFLKQIDDDDLLNNPLLQQRVYTKEGHILALQAADLLVSHSKDNVHSYLSAKRQLIAVGTIYNQFYWTENSGAISHSGKTVVSDNKTLVVAAKERFNAIFDLFEKQLQQHNIKGFEDNEWRQWSEDIFNQNKEFLNNSKILNKTQPLFIDLLFKLERSDLVQQYCENMITNLLDSMNPYYVVTDKLYSLTIIDFVDDARLAKLIFTDKVIESITNFIERVNYEITCSDNSDKLQYVLGDNASSIAKMLKQVIKPSNTEALYYLGQVAAFVKYSDEYTQKFDRHSSTDYRQSPLYSGSYQLLSTIEGSLELQAKIRQELFLESNGDIKQVLEQAIIAYVDAVKDNISNINWQSPSLQLAMHVYPEKLSGIFEAKLKEILDSQNAKQAVKFLPLLNKWLKTISLTDECHQQNDSINKIFAQHIKGLDSVASFSSQYVTLYLMANINFYDSEQAISGAVKLYSNKLADENTLDDLIIKLSSNAYGNVDLDIDTDFSKLAMFEPKQSNKFNSYLLDFGSKKLQSQSLFNQDNSVNISDFYHDLSTVDGDSSVDTCFRKYLVAEYLADKDTIIKAQANYLTQLVAGLNTNSITISDQVQLQLQRIKQHSLLSLTSYGSIKESTDVRHLFRQQLEVLEQRIESSWSKTVGTDTVDKLLELWNGKDIQLLYDYSPDLYLKLWMSLLPKVNLSHQDFQRFKESIKLPKLSLPDKPVLLEKLEAYIKQLIDSMKDVLSPYQGNIQSKPVEIEATEESQQTSTEFGAVTKFLNDLKSEGQGLFADISGYFSEDGKSKKPSLDLGIDFNDYLHLDETNVKIKALFKLLSTVMGAIVQEVIIIIGDGLQAVIDAVASIDYAAMFGAVLDKIAQFGNWVLKKLNDLTRLVTEKSLDMLNAVVDQVQVMTNSLTTVAGQYQHKLVDMLAERQRLKQLEDTIASYKVGQGNQDPYLLRLLLAHVPASKRQDVRSTLIKLISNVEQTTGVQNALNVIQKQIESADDFRITQQQTTNRHFGPLSLLISSDLPIFNAFDEQPKAYTALLVYLNFLALKDNKDISTDQMTSWLQHVNEFYQPTPFWQQQISQHLFLTPFFKELNTATQLESYRFIYQFANEQLHDEFVNGLLKQLLEADTKTVLGWFDKVNQQLFDDTPKLFSLKTPSGRSSFKTLIENSLGDNGWSESLDIIARAYLSHETFRDDNQAHSLLRDLNRQRLSARLSNVAVAKSYQSGFFQSDDYVFKYDCKTYDCNMTLDFLAKGQDELNNLNDIFSHKIFEYVKPNKNVEYAQAMTNLRKVIEGGSEGSYRDQLAKLKSGVAEFFDLNSFYDDLDNNPLLENSFGRLFELLKKNSEFKNPQFELINTVMQMHQLSKELSVVAASIKQQATGYDIASHVNAIHKLVDLYITYSKELNKDYELLTIIKKINDQIAELKTNSGELKSQLEGLRNKAIEDEASYEKINDLVVEKADIGLQLDNLNASFKSNAVGVKEIVSDYCDVIKMVAAFVTGASEQEVTVSSDNTVVATSAMLENNRKLNSKKVSRTASMSNLNVSGARKVAGYIANNTDTIANDIKSFVLSSGSTKDMSASSKSLIANMTGQDVAQTESNLPVLLKFAVMFDETKSKQIDNILGSLSDKMDKNSAINAINSLCDIYDVPQKQGEYYIKAINQASQDQYTTLIKYSALRMVSPKLSTMLNEVLTNVGTSLQTKVKQRTSFQVTQLESNESALLNQLDGLEKTMESARGYGGFHNADINKVKSIGVELLADELTEAYNAFDSGFQAVKNGDQAFLILGARHLQLLIRYAGYAEQINKVEFLAKLDKLVSHTSHDGIKEIYSSIKTCVEHPYDKGAARTTVTNYINILSDIMVGLNSRYQPAKLRLDGLLGTNNLLNSWIEALDEPKVKITAVERFVSTILQAIEQANAKGLVGAINYYIDELAKQNPQDAMLGYVLSLVKSELVIQNEVFDLSKGNIKDKASAITAKILSVNGLKNVFVIKGESSNALSAKELFNVLSAFSTQLSRGIFDKSVYDKLSTDFMGVKSAVASYFDQLITLCQSGVDGSNYFVADNVRTKAAELQSQFNLRQANPYLIAFADALEAYANSEDSQRTDDVRRNLLTTMLQATPRLLINNGLVVESEQWLQLLDGLGLTESICQKVHNLTLGRSMEWSESMDIQKTVETESIGVHSSFVKNDSPIATFAAKGHLSVPPNEQKGQIKDPFTGGSWKPATVPTRAQNANLFRKQQPVLTDVPPTEEKAKEVTKPQSIPANGNVETKQEDIVSSTAEKSHLETRTDNCSAKMVSQSSTVFNSSETNLQSTPYLTEVDTLDVDSDNEFSSGNDFIDNGELFEIELDDDSEENSFGM